ncbi:MAG TPA: transglycosylase SLT domain-containing protein [Vicinamibacterales bacterium]|nr:transglycosylase SLT domain-containing protein [Vicinamibacterales bacterium]
MKMRAPLLFVSMSVCLAAAAPARAELAFFANGQSMSIKAHRVDGESLVLSLRSGGEIVCEPALIVRFAPDEVPYSEPEAAPPVQATLLPAVEAGPYSEIIDKVAAEQGVPAKLVHAVIKVESDYRERARSRKGAIGLMQLMPETAKRFAVADPYNPRQNIEGGIKYLKTLLDRFPTTDLVLAAYNAGEAAVDRFRGIPPYAETRDYVSRILRILGQ